MFPQRFCRSELLASPAESVNKFYTMIIRRLSQFGKILHSNTPAWRILGGGWLFWLLVSPVQGQVFTVQVGASPTPLVNHSDAWRYHKGTNAPGLGWQTNADATLGGTWLTGNGGFGYSTDTPNEVSLCQTILSDMTNNYTTVYIRRSFEVTNAADASLHLRLMMDYDDGFVAYLDGVELARDRVLTAVNVEPSNTGVASSAHESSRGSAPVNPATTYDLGAVGSRLQPGTHVLALIGLNATIASSDFVLLADLSLAPTATSIVNGPLLSIVHGSSVPLAGVSTLPGSTRVTVNGSDATFNAGTGAWSKNQSLVPGYNRLIIEALDAAGVPLVSTNQVVVSEITSNTVTTLGLNTVLDNSGGIIHVTNSLTVPAGGSLTIHSNAVLLLGPGVNLRATNDASLTVNGAYLLTADGATMWGEIAADGSNSFLTIRHAETIGGAVKGRNGATGLLEDTFFHDYKNGSVPIGGCTDAISMTVRRCHFRIYHETLWQHTLMLVEDNLFELANNPSSDALDFDGAIIGSVIRRCTFRHGPQSNTDAVDIGPTTSGNGSTNTIIESCLMYDFPNDKGVSIGEGSYGIEVRNCLLYGNDSGVAVKNSPGGKPPCTANVHDCTIVDNDYGFRCYNKTDVNALTDGGQITNSYNNIVWSNRFAIAQLLNGGYVIADHTDFNGTNWPGEGNIQADPLFLDAARRDYRLAANSPCIGTGRDGATLGAKFPVGATMAPSHSYFSTITVTNGAVKLGFWVDSEKNYSVLCSDVATGGTWTKVTNVYHQMLPRFVEVTNPFAGGANRFYRLVTPHQP